VPSRKPASWPPPGMVRAVSLASWDRGPGQGPELCGWVVRGWREPGAGIVLEAALGLRAGEHPPWLRQGIHQMEKWGNCLQGK
jgi:hypothetical protein